MNGESLTPGMGGSAGGGAMPNKTLAAAKVAKTPAAAKAKKAVKAKPRGKGKGDKGSETKGRKRPWNSLAVDTELVLKSCSINSPMHTADFTCGQLQSQLLTGPQLTGSLRSGVGSWEGTISQKLKLEIDTSEPATLCPLTSMTTSVLSVPSPSCGGSTDDEESPVPTDDEDCSYDGEYANIIGIRRVKFKLEMPSGTDGGLMLSNSEATYGGDMFMADHEEAMDLVGSSTTEAPSGTFHDYEKQELKDLLVEGASNSQRGVSASAWHPFNNVQFQQVTGPA